MNHVFTLCGQEHEVWLARPDTSGYRLQVDGKRLAVALLAQGEQVHELRLHTQRHRIVVALQGDDVHIHLDGETHVLRYCPSLTRFASQAIDEGEAVLRAPMPGAVISVAVQPGDTVARGQALLVIESMKMETTISARHDGSVQAVHVVLGQTFERDAALVTLAPGNTPP